ncbi:MAG: RNA polymerase sigma factor [Clostridia bacterium]|nr:RNA polymerase sigma factor [Clostridia bacterium]
MKREISRELAEEIFKEHSTYVYRIALFLMKSRELAEDVTQETMIQVFRKYHTYDSSKPIRPWIYKIAVNTTRNMLRKQKWLRFIGEVPESDHSEVLESTVVKSEEEKELWREINNLTLKSREVIILHFYAGMKLKEVSDILSVPLGTCKSRLNSALNTLRKQLPRNEFDFLDRGGNAYETI